MMKSQRFFRWLLAIALCQLGSGTSLAENWVSAPAPRSAPVNQLRTDGNACGPACLLDAFRSGNEKWQASAKAIAGKNDHDKVKTIAKTYGRRGSRLDRKKARWNSRYGVSGIDLTDMANEMRQGKWMGTVKQRIYFKKAHQKPAALLKHVHRDLRRSLKKGLPPILRIRRMAWRTPKGGRTKAWLAVKRHYIVLTGLPNKLPRGATSFQVTYHDPWGGKSCRGVIEIPTGPTTPVGTLIANFPQSGIGKNKVAKGEASVISLSSAVGLF